MPSIRCRRRHENMGMSQPPSLNAETFDSCRIDTSAMQQDNARAAERTTSRRHPCLTNARHMDVYPSRNVDTREHRVPAMHNKLICCGDRLRSAGAFLD